MGDVHHLWRRITVRRSKRLTPQVEGMEARALLAPIPVLTTQAFSQAVHSIDDAAGRFARNRNQGAFSLALAQIASHLPFGRQNLLPTWFNDVTGIYSPTVPGS